MNRRQAIRRVVGVGAGLAAIPLMSKTGEGASVPSYGPPTVAPEWKEPPLDHRTPEQVLEESLDTWAADLIRESESSYNKYHKYAWTDVNPEIFTRIQDKIQAQQKTVDLRTIAGRECLVINGNVVARRV